MKATLQTLLPTGLLKSTNTDDKKIDYPYSSEIMRLKSVLYEASNCGWTNKYLILLRGLPGSGKSTLARFLVEKLTGNVVIASEDDYFIDAIDHVYKRDNRKLNDAIAACKQKVWSSMHSGVLVIIVDNCNLTQLEMDPYIREGVRNGYSIHLVETNTPWRYNSKKLIKLTHNGYNLQEIDSMLEKFDRTLNIEEIVSSVKSLYPSLRRPLPSPSMMNKMNSQAEVIPTAPPIMCSSSSAVANNNTSIFTSTSLITNMNLYQPVDNYCHGDNNDNQLPINNNDDDSENNLAENNSFNAETTTTTLEEYDQSEHWLTPTGSIEALSINHTDSVESCQQGHVDYPTSSLVKETNSSSQQQQLQHEKEEEQPQPSTSYGKLGELMCIFPNLKSDILAEFLSLAHDDVSWATTLILDNRTSERINQREAGETNQCIVVESKISSDEHLSFTCPSTSSLHSTTTVCSASSTNNTATATTTTITTTTNEEAHSIRQEDNPIDLSLVSSSSEPLCCQDDNHSSTFNPYGGIKLSRDFLKTAHEEYAFSLGLSHVDLSPEAVPDFLINEWIPEPNLTKEIYMSIMRHLGVLVNNNSTGNNTLTPTFLSTSNTRNINEIKAKKTANKSKIPSSSFLQIMHDEEGLLRSVEDFRTSLNTPVIRIIMDRLMSKFPGTQKSVIEEAFVRCEFDETRTEIYLLSYYKSSSELTEKTNTPSTAVAATATTNVADLSSTNTVNGLANDFRDVSLNPTTINTTYNNNNNLNGLLIGQHNIEENLSLQEIQDEEEALNRSIEDQKVRLQTLANQLCLSRLKAQFPGIEINYLENLFIRFDLNEQNLMDYFIKQGFIPQPLNPFLVETANKFNENADTDMTYCSQEYSSHGNALSPSHQVNSINCSTNNSEWLNMLNKRIESIRQKIIHAKCDLSYAKDSRVKQFRVTELRSLQNELYYFNLQKAEYLVDTRSILYETELLTNGERPISAACLAFAYLDLHGLNKSCALSVLQQRLSYLKDKLNSTKNTQNSTINVPKYFTVITGRAAGCESDLVSIAPVLRPAVIQYLTKNGYKFEENFRIGSGHFTVNLNNNHSRLIS